MRSSFNRFFRSTEGKILFGLVVCGAILRFLSIQYGLPRLYFDDERFFVAPALHIAGGGWDPQWYGAPGQTVIYGVAFLFSIVNTIMNFIHGTSLTVAENYQANITAFQTAGRVLPALAGTLMVLPAYLIGSRWSKRAGLWAAGLITFSYYLVDVSHIIRPDILQTFFLFWVIFFGIRIAEQPKRLLWYLLFGISFGLGVATKYPTLFLIVPMVVFVLGLARSHAFLFSKWVIAALTAVCATFLTGPYLFLRFNNVLIDIAYENRALMIGHDKWNMAQNFWWYVTHVLSFEVGTFLVMLVLATLTVITLRARRWGSSRVSLAVMIFFTTITYLAALSALRLHWEHWIVPVTALTFILAGIGIDVLLGLRVRRFISVLMVVALLAGPAMRLARTLYGFLHPPTAEVARDWMLHNIPSGSMIVYEMYSPEIPADRYTPIFAIGQNWSDRDSYLEQGAAYFIITGGVYGVIANEAERFGSNSRFGAAMRQYDALIASGTELYAINPNPRYTRNELLTGNDISVLRTLDLSLLRGYSVRIFSFQR